MTHGSVFSGIGGFDLAAEWVGWENVFHCEANPFRRQALNFYWPHAKSYEDIRETDFTFWRGRIGVLSGGFPCQPYSTAGLRKGKDDERNLWPAMLECIRQCKPRWVVCENVYGFVDWSGGMVLDETLTDLEGEAYQAQSVVIPAVAKNAPHRRDRLWIVARRRPDASNADDTGCEGEGKRGKPETQEARPVRGSIGWQGFPAEPAVCRGNDGVPTGLVGITVPKHRLESIRAYGDAIVPQVAFEIFKVIQKMEDDNLAP